MSNYDSHYPGYDVMELKEHWDPHTRQIVERRLKQQKFQSLHEEEINLLYDICSLLLNDSDPSKIAYVVTHFDNKLTSDIGEAERKKSDPKQSTLIRQGLRALDLYCIQTYGKPYLNLAAKEKMSLLSELSAGTPQLEVNHRNIPSISFFKTLLTEAVSAYYSHPDVWSEIGYGGPAYPRGYVRSEWGLTDPWEAKREDAES